MPQDPKVQQALDRLHAGLAALETSEQWQSYLQAALRFHDYSFSNSVLILLQNPKATKVAGYNTWRSLKRQVRRGEHGLLILAPCAGRPTIVTDTDGTERQAPAPTRHFRPVCVFDISQTEGEPVPEAPISDLAGEDPTQLYERLAALARADGYSASARRP